MNILSVNLNGLGIGEFKAQWVCDLIKAHRIGVVGIQETKRRQVDEMVIRRIWGSQDYEFVCVGSLGQSGGLVSIWNNQLFEKEQAISREDCIVLQGRWKENNEPICIINVYGSQNQLKREELWGFITAIINSWQGVLMIHGDFNEVRSKEERRGSNFDERSASKFNDFINSNNLIDVKINGSNFKWIKGGGEKMSKLDRILVSNKFGEIWPNFEVLTEARLHSDHKPLILRQITRNFGTTPFKLYNSWMEIEQFESIIKETWSNYNIEGQHLKLYIIMRKLRDIKDKIKK